MLPVIAVILISARTTRAADLSAGPGNDSDAACGGIKDALHALGDAEHDEGFALDLAAGGGNSAAIVEERLSILLDRTQDLRVALKRARQGSAANDPMVEDCTRLGYRALVMAEKLSSEVESVLFGADDSVAEAPPGFRPGAPAGSPPARQP